MNAHELRSPAGSITITPGALTQIVLHAVELVDGARARRPRRGLELDVADGRAKVEVELAAPVGAVLPDVARDVQERVAAALERMCGVEVTSVDVSIEELEG